MEEGDLASLPAVPWDLFWGVHHAEHASLGSKIIRGRSLDHTFCALLPVVWYLSPAGLCGLVLWL